MNTQKRFISQTRRNNFLVFSLILILFLTSATILTAEFQKQVANNFKPIKTEQSREEIVLPYTDDCGAYTTPEWEFITYPVTIMTSWYDYMPFSYVGFQIVKQTENGDGYYMTWHATPDNQPTTNRRQYWAYINANGSLNDFGTITEEDIWQGYGDMCMHPSSGNPLGVWHQSDAATGYGVGISYDQFNLQNIPGNWHEMGFYPPPPPAYHEFIWPQLYSGPSPEGENYIRIYLISRNYSYSPQGNPCDVPRIMYMDIENINEPNVLEPIFNFENWTAVYPMTNWWVNDIRPMNLSFAIDYNNPGRVAMLGKAANLSGNPAPVENGPFVWISDDYGTSWNDEDLYGTGEPLYSVENIPGFVNNSGNLLESIEVWCVASKSTGIFDSQGNIHWPYVQSYGTEEEVSFYFFPEYLPQAQLTWNYDDGFSFRNVPKLGGDDPGGHSVPWEIDEATGDTILYYCQGWSSSGDIGDMLFHENIQKQAANIEEGWMVQLWVDGTYHYMNSIGLPGFSAYDEHPLIFLSASNDDGETWTAPIQVTDINNPNYNFEDECTVYPTIYRNIENLGNGWGLVTIGYYDDFSLSQDLGGNIKYMQVKINFEDLGSSITPEPEITSINNLTNFPNPFTESTTISFA
ncbi:MAG: hypothetical protein U9P79_01610, partial [Candidatus Cloacimonadota bacterium]|nr:hypothetical protein [Candidatus Cloacimonadota bacterium]